MSERFRCSAASLVAQEPLYATASVVRRWVLLEQPGPWGANALLDGRLPSGLGAALLARGREVGARVLLIRRHRRSRRTTRTAFVAWTGAETPWLEEFALDGPGDLLDLDWTPLARGRPLGGTPRAEPVLLACTNGRHDACCAEFGRPLARALDRRYGALAWESSHFGGDRFAGNLVCLPHGLYFGRLGPEDGERVAAGYLDGHIELSHYRGRSCFPFVVQAGEYYVRTRTGAHAIDAVQLRGAPEVTGSGARVRFAVDASTVTVELGVSQEPAAHPLTCTGRPALVPRYTLLSLRQEDAGRPGQAPGATGVQPG